MAHWTDQSEDGKTAEISEICHRKACLCCMSFRWWKSSRAHECRLFVSICLQSSVIYLLSVYCSDFYLGSRGQQTKWVANRRKCSEVSVWIPLPTGSCSQKPVFRNTATRQRFHNKASIIAHLFEVWEMREKTGSPGKNRCSFINRYEHKSSFHYGEQLRATNALKDTRRE